MKKNNAPVLAVAALALVTGLLLYRNVASQPAAAPPENIAPIPENVPRPASPDKPDKVTVYRLVEQQDGSFRLRPLEVSITGAREPMAAALNAMAGLPDSPLPAGARARSAKNEGNGLAVVDFNKAFLDNFPTGLEDQALAVNAILQTMAQFYGVEKVQFLIEGSKITDIDTHQDLAQPLPVRGDATTEAGQ